MNGSSTVSLGVMAGLIAAAWWVLEGQPGAGPGPSGVGRDVTARFTGDLATIHRSAARRLRSGEISSESDLKRYIAFAQKASRPRWSAELAQSQAAIGGTKWTRESAAALCDRLASQFEQ